MAASIYDVAKRAGVSISTVSRVLNNPEAVSEKKVTAVREAMTYYNYEPNQFARGLVKQQSNMIGVYFSETDGHSLFDSTYNLELLKGIEKTLAYQNYSMALICETAEYRQQVNAMPKYLEYIKQKRIDGLILSGLNNKILKSSVFEQVMNEGYPVVYIGKKFHEKGLNVYAHYEQYVLQMLEILRQNGHRKILYYSHVMHERYTKEIFAQVATGMPEITLCSVSLDIMEYSREKMLADIKRYVMEEGCTAICLPGMNIAQIAINICAELQIPVPEQVSLLAVEHQEGEGEKLFPPVSAFYVPTKNMGSSAANLLLQAIRQDENRENSIEFEAKYIQRNSIRRL